MSKVTEFKELDSQAPKRKAKRKAALSPTDGKPIEQYTHKGKDRVNNPPVGLIS